MLMMKLFLLLHKMCIRDRSSIVVEACSAFIKDHADVELHVTGKKEELETLTHYERIQIVDARDVVPMAVSYTHLVSTLSK